MGWGPLENDVCPTDSVKAWHLCQLFRTWAQASSSCSSREGMTAAAGLGEAVCRGSRSPLAGDRALFYFAYSNRLQMSLILRLHSAAPMVEAVGLEILDDV